MAITKPYYGIYRPCFFKTDIVAYDYIRDEEYFESKAQHIMAYFLISEDLKKVFEYVEPIDAHRSVYSHRLYELLLRTCTEIESIFSELLSIHDYRTQKNKNRSYNLKMNDFFELEKYMKLSQYTATFREKLTITPYLAWNSTSFKPLKWYTEYNNLKHNRFNYFSNANLFNVLEALSGLYVLLNAQFSIYADSVEDEGIMISSLNELFTITNLPYYKLFFIKDKPVWLDNEKYDFNWGALKNDPNRFQKITF